MDELDAKGNSPLCEAVWRQDKTAVTALVQAGANSQHACLQKIPETYQKAVGLSGSTAGTATGLSTGAVVGIGVGAAALIGGGVALAAGGGGSGSDHKDACENVVCDGANQHCNNGQCVCDTGFTMFDGVCYETLSCVNGTQNADMCVCRPGYAGTLCETCDTGYINQGGVCYVELTCGANQHQEADACVCNAGFGFYGTGECHVTLACKDGTQQGAVCVCNGHASGDLCDTCESGYGFHGTNVCYADLACVNGSQTGSACVCTTEGWTGTLCDTPASCDGYEYSTCPVGYAPSATCLSGDTTKLQCNRCAEGYGKYGTNECHATISCSDNQHQQGDTCVCDTGYEMVGGVCTFTSCPANQYKVGSECLSCPENSTSPAGSTSINQCVCNGGYIKTAAGLCVEQQANEVGSGYVYKLGKDTGYKVYNNYEDIVMTDAPISSDLKTSGLKVVTEGSAINHANITGEASIEDVDLIGMEVNLSDTSVENVNVSLTNNGKIQLTAPDYKSTDVFGMYSRIDDPMYVAGDSGVYLEGITNYNLKIENNGSILLDSQARNIGIYAASSILDKALYTQDNGTILIINNGEIDAETGIIADLHKAVEVINTGTITASSGITAGDGETTIVRNSGTIDIKGDAIIAKGNKVYIENIGTITVHSETAREGYGTAIYVTGLTSDGYKPTTAEILNKGTIVVNAATPFDGIGYSSQDLFSFEKSSIINDGDIILNSTAWNTRLSAAIEASPFISAEDRDKYGSLEIINNGNITGPDSSEIIGIDASVSYSLTPEESNFQFDLSVINNGTISLDSGVGINMETSKENEGTVLFKNGKDGLIEIRNRTSSNYAISTKNTDIENLGTISGNISVDGGNIINLGTIEGLIEYNTSRGGYSLINSGDIIAKNRGISVSNSDKENTLRLINEGTITVSGNEDADYNGFYGIRAIGNVAVYNAGTITLNNTAKSGAEATYCITHECYYDIGTDAYYKTRTGTGTFYDQYVYSDYYGTTKNFVLLYEGASLVVSKEVISSGNLDLSSFSPDGTGSVSLLSGGNLQAETISGNLHIDASNVTSGFNTTYTNTNAIQANDTTALNLISDSHLFDASLAENGKDVLMTMKSFDDVTSNKSLAAFLEQNYVGQNNEAFFNELKSISSARAFTSALNNLTATDTFHQFAHEDLTALRDVNLHMNALMFANNDNPVFQKAGTFNAFSFQNDSSSSAQFALAHKRVSPYAKIGYAMSTTHLNSDNRRNTTRRNDIFQAFTPIGYDRFGWQLISTPQIGFARAHYTRKGYNGASYDGVMEKRIVALMNEARYPMEFGPLTVAPTVEFNALFYNQKGNETKKAYSLTMPSDNKTSVEAGVGFHADTRFKDVSFTAGIMFYREFADPYNMKLGMNGMDGSFDLFDEQKKYRGAADFGFGYHVGSFNLYGSLRHFIETQNRTQMKAGLTIQF